MKKLTKECINRGIFNNEQPQLHSLPQRIKTVPLWILIFIVILANIILYSKTTQYDFVDIDDQDYVVNNPLIRKFDGDQIKKIFTQPYFQNYQPLVILSYAAEYKYFNLQSGKYHFTNIIFHIMNSVLVLFLVFQITKGNKWIALIIAMLFSVHPMQVESVAWISERKELMCAFFYFLSFIAYIRYCRGNPCSCPDGQAQGLPLQKQKKVFYFLSILLFLFALLSKPMAVTFPLILVLFDYYEEKLSKSKLFEKTPFFVLSVVFSIITYMAQKQGGAVHEEQFVFANLFFAFHNIGFYISKLILPINLLMHYEYPRVTSLFSKEFIIDIFIITSLVIYLLNFKKIKREVNFGFLFFLISLIPILKIIPIGTAIAANRYVYIPIISFFFTIAMLLNSMLPKCRLIFKRVLVITVVMYILNLGVLTNTESKIWKNPPALWAKTLRVYPTLYGALVGIGNYYFEEKDFKNALKYYFPILNDKTGNKREWALYNIGLTFFNENKLEESKKYFAMLVDEYPTDKYNNNRFAYMYLGLICSMMNNFQEGFKFYEQGLKLDQNNYQIHYYYGLSLEIAGNITQAVKHYQFANRLNKEYAPPKEALKRLGIIQ